ncbi:hypothetical protein F9948_03885 [Burkholderia thailandensis]|nr:hypothetical protein [Burkholderia thailandensis]MDD1485192.1 hypothetical protein [Burkholderia thailandensis]
MTPTVRIPARRESNARPLAPARRPIDQECAPARRPLRGACSPHDRGAAARMSGRTARCDQRAITGGANMQCPLENVSARCASHSDRAVSRERRVLEAAAAS